MIKMKKIENFINENLIEFNNLDNSEVCEIDINDFDNEIVDYLIKNYRFDYKDICVYLWEDINKICVENMNS
jgi:hypothetical protein